MKTQKEIEEMAKSEAAELNLLEEQEFKEGYIKGYQAAQEEMKQSKKEICYNCNATVEMVIIDTMCPECKC